MKYLYLTPLLFLVACTGRDAITTAHYIEVKLTGTDAAYCVLSTQDNRYALAAPGKTLVERDNKDLKIDCQDNYSDRRRTVTIAPEFDLMYWVYPESVVVDFASYGQVDNGFRLKPTSKAKEVLTEKSYSAPIDETPRLNVQTYETTVEQNLIIEEDPVNLNMTDNGRRSYPIAD